MLTHTTFEIVWFRCCLPDTSIHPSQPTPLYCDNKSSIDIAHNDVFHGRTKHIEIDFLFIWEHVWLCTILIELYTLPSHNQHKGLLNSFPSSWCFRQHVVGMGGRVWRDTYKLNGPWAWALGLRDSWTSPKRACIVCCNFPIRHHYYLVYSNVITTATSLDRILLYIRRTIGITKDTEILLNLFDRNYHQCVCRKLLSMCVI